MNRAARIAAVCVALAAAPLIAFAAPPVEGPAIPCASDSAPMLTGGQAGPGTSFSVAIGMTVPTPARPVNGWILTRCNAEQVFFTRPDPVGKDVMTAWASHISLDGWTDEDAFEAQVRRTVEAGRTPGQRLRIVSLQAVAVDGRPCVDVLRVGTLEAPPASVDVAPRQMFTRERLRACHLRDARGPEAGVMIVFKEMALHDPLRFDDMARPFVEGVTLPAWSR